MVAWAVEEHLEMPHIVVLMDLEDCPFFCPFMVPMAVCLMLVPLDCGGFMTDSSVLGDEMM